VSLPENGDWWIAPSAVVLGKVTLGAGSSVWYGAVLRGDFDKIVIGERTNIQDLCVLHTNLGEPLHIGTGVTVGHKAMLHGCTIGDNSLVGINSVILDRVVVGRNCLIGAGALLTPGKEFPDNSLIIGSPARVARQVTEKDLDMNRTLAQTYYENWQRHREMLAPQSASI
jgi:carbonic anhydrase/acetyltransferase-like protein (isoleucine patch superfamily)